MKQLFILIVSLFLLSVNSFAQDIIFILDGSEIEAKVLQVADDCVKYKNFNHQDGPERILKTENIFMIKYENGEKEMFNNRNNKVGQPSVKQVTIDPELRAEFEGIGTDDVAMLDFFYDHKFRTYHEDFSAACRQRSTGSTLLTSGILLTSVGLIVGTMAYVQKEYPLAAGFYTAAVIGDGLIIASIPVSATAGARKERIKNNFAREYFGDDRYAYQPSLNFGVTSHGIGLTLHF